MYNNFGGLDHLEAIRGRLRKLEAVFGSFFVKNVECIKNVKWYGPYGDHQRPFKNIGGCFL